MRLWLSESVAPSSREVFSLADIFLTVLLLFFTAAFFHAHGSLDVDRFWLDWIYTLSLHDNFRDGFAGVWADYPPISIYMLDIVRRLSLVSGWEPFVWLKLSMMLFLALTTFLYYWLSGKKSVALLAYFIWFPSSVLLVYLDIWYAPALLLCFACLYAQRVGWGLFWFAVACSIKYQPAILAPFVAVYVWQLYREQSACPGREAAKAVCLTLFLYLLLMFSMVGGELVASWMNALLHNRLSFQGLNAYWAYMQLHVMNGVEVQAVRNASDGLLYGSRLAFLVGYGILLWRFATQPRHFASFLLYAMTGFYAYFVVISGVHENHLFVGALVASVLYIVRPPLRAVALFVMLMHNINILLFNGLTGGGLNHSLVWGGLDMTVPLALVNTLFFAGLFMVLVFVPGRVQGGTGAPGISK